MRIQQHKMSLPPLPTTTPAIIINCVQRMGQVLRHDEKGTPDCLVRGGKNRHRWGMTKKRPPLSLSYRIASSKQRPHEPTHSTHQHQKPPTALVTTIDHSYSCRRSLPSLPEEEWASGYQATKVNGWWSVAGGSSFKSSCTPGCQSAGDSLSLSDPTIIFSTVLQ